MRSMYTKPKVLAGSVKIREPKLEYVLLEVDGHTERLAVEPTGALTVRGPKLGFREHVSWPQSEFSTLEPEHALRELVDAVKEIRVVSADERGNHVKTFPSWPEFVAWLGRPSELMNQVPWGECRIFNLYLPEPMHVAVETLAAEQKTYKRNIVIEALGEYLDKRSDGRRRRRAAKTP